MRQWIPAIVANVLYWGFLLFWLGAVSVTAASGDAPHGIVEYFLYRYQAFLAGGVAIAAAIIGANLVRLQIVHDSNLAKDARDRKARAARAVLPLALTSLVEYASESFRAMQKLREQCDDHLLPSPVPEPPAIVEFPENTLDPMAAYIEHTDDEVATALATLIAKLQIQRSRSLETLRHAAGIKARAMVLDINVESYMIDAAEIYARTSALFDHARHGAAPDPIVGASVAGAMRLLGLDDLKYEDIFLRVVDRKSWELRQ